MWWAGRWGLFSVPDTVSEVAEEWPNSPAKWKLSETLKAAHAGYFRGPLKVEKGTASLLDLNFSVWERVKNSLKEMPV